MTESEAIKKHIDECSNRIENISFFMDSNSDDNKEECCNNIEILQKVINALEKQIPKKMVIKNDNGRPSRACVGCGCFVLPASRFCSKCGQKLDWSDEE